MSAEHIYLKAPPGFANLDEAALWKKYTANRAEVNSYVYRISEEKYRYWNKAQFKEAPTGFSKAEAWFLAREIRKISSRPIPVRDTQGMSFTWLRPQYTDALLRQIDMEMGGSFLVSDKVLVSEPERQRYLSRGIIEEAIASSQLEGADTSRRYAKRMISEHIQPRNQSDWMILNNHAVLSRIDDEYKSAALSWEMLLDIHAQLTRNTLSDETEVGRFRQDKDDIVVTFEGKVAHVPPPETVMIHELERLIAYANEDEPFVHPVIKAIILHFWIGYLHPFTDGNGRTARALFYWYMSKHNYWATAYLPISLVIKQAPSRYVYAYIYAEQDNLDFTYFFDYHIKKIIQAIDDFKGYVNRVHAENAQITRHLKPYRLNDRQKQLVRYLLAAEHNEASVAAHKTMTGVTRQTAYRDFVELEANGLVVPQKQGRTVRYTATGKLRSLSAA